MKTHTTTYVLMAQHKKHYGVITSGQSRREKPHKENINTPINETVGKDVKPVYKQLTSSCDKLMEGCMTGKPQNSNENLHSVIWGSVLED